MELHGTVGPANTTVTDVAKLAGVSRMTVYNHFPTEADLFTACSTHWTTENPFPDPATWLSIEDRPERLTHGLQELYAWYGLKVGMLAKILRDAPNVPALAEVMEGLWSGYMAGLVQALAHEESVENGHPEEFLAMLRLAVDFNTWQVLTTSGLDDEVAAELIARMVTRAT